MNLGEIIDLCKKKPDLPVRALDLVTRVRTRIVDAESYRGFYDQVALVPGGRVGMTGAALAQALENLMATGMEGYKGGEYVPDRDTAVWVARNGSASGIRVLAGSITHGQICLICSQID